MRQDLVEKYAKPGHRAGDVGAVAQGREGVGQRVADPGTAEHRRRLVQPGDRRLAGRHRLDQQHVPHQRRTVRQPHRRRSTPACCRPRPSPSPPSAAARRSPRSSGPAAAAARSTARPSTSARFFSGRGVATNYISPTDDRRLRRLVRPAVRPSGRLCRPGAVPRAAPVAATGWTNVPTSLQPGEGDAPARARLRRRQVRPQRLHLRLHQRQPGQLQPRAVLADEGRGRRGRRLCARASGPTSRSRSSAAALGRQDRRLCWSRSKRLTRDLSQVRLFHTSVTRAIAIVADVARRARLHRRLRRVRRPEVPVVDGRRLRRPRSRHRQRGDLRRAGSVLGERCTTRCIKYILEHVPARSGAGRLSGDRRVPAPVPRT